jgi:hypothetical protein
LRVEVVTVSVGYADFLAATLAENLPHIDHMVVITSPDDKDTQKVCRKHSIQYIMTEDHKRHGTPNSEVFGGRMFNKGRLIRRGFDQLSAKDWVLHLDADVVLPRQFRRLLELAHLDPEYIYGADRQDVKGFDRWNRLKSTVGPWNNHCNETAHWFHPDFRMGSRWVSSIHGYVPIGFFQLFHGTALIDGGYHVRNYPIHHGNACRSDVQFAVQWDRRQRQVVPELVVLHLMSDDAQMGINWEGRKSSKFEARPGPKPGPKPHPHPEPKPPHHPPHPEPRPEPHPCPCPPCPPPIPYW